jgi:hypothetical protein
LDIAESGLAHGALEGTAHQFAFAHNCFTFDMAISRVSDRFLRVFLTIFARDAVLVRGSRLRLFHNLLRLASKSRCQVAMLFEHFVGA